MHNKRKEDHNAYKHGQATGNNRTPLYRRWRAIIDRCNYQSNVNFKRYGGAGIKCLWTSFTAFRDDMERGFLEHAKAHGVENTTIERINSTGHYCKENCRWATYAEQARNISTNRIITFRGETLCMSDMARKYGLHPTTLQGRLNRGWNIERALTQKLDPRGSCAAIAMATRPLI